MPPGGDRLPPGLAAPGWFCGGRRAQRSGTIQHPYRLRRVGPVDWDEAGVDYADLDLADLPIRSCARSQLARLRGGQHSFG